MDFDRWFANQGKPAPTKPSKPFRKVKQLTEDAQWDRDAFEKRDDEYGVSLADRGCICFTGCAPCSYCTHPGNPVNQEIDECWELVDEDAVTRDTE